MRDNLPREIGNNSGADQPADPCSVLSAFVISFFWKVSFQNMLQAKFHYSILSYDVARLGVK